jgi:polyphosphate kinase
VEVFYGFSKLKVHAKIAIIQRREKGELRLYSHLSTGNYHSGTARQYTDLAILTSNPTIGADAMTFFDRVSEGVVPLSFKVLLSAPTRLHKRLQSLIEAEIKATQSGKSGRIFAKMNALVDENIIQSLYRASNAGVRIDLVVRGACSLIPGVPGLSQNIRVLSIVDRYLEHSRIYYFESSRSLYLSSADWMPRNFFSRLEIAFPVLSEEIYAYIRDFIIPTYLSDTAKARELTAEGVWKPVQPSIPGLTPLRSQARFEELALTQYRGTPLRKFKSNLTAN